MTRKHRDWRQCIYPTFRGESPVHYTEVAASSLNLLGIDKMTDNGNVISVKIIVYTDWVTLSSHNLMALIILSLKNHLIISLTLYKISEKEV